MRIITVIMVAFVAIMVAGCERAPTWKSNGFGSIETPNKGRQIDADLPGGGRKITDYDDEGNIIRDQDYEVRRKRRPPVETERFVVDQEEDGEQSLLSRFRKMQSRGRERSHSRHSTRQGPPCKACRPGYHPEPRPGFPCGCGR